MTPSPGANSHVGVKSVIGRPDASVAVSVKRTTSPVRTWGDAGDSVNDRTSAEITSTANCSRAAPAVAVRVARPPLTPITVPSDETRATPGEELVHETRSSARRSPVAERTVVPRWSDWPARSLVGRGSIAIDAGGPGRIG